MNFKRVISRIIFSILIKVFRSIDFQIEGRNIEHLFSSSLTGVRLRLMQERNIAKGPFLIPNPDRLKLLEKVKVEACEAKSAYFEPLADESMRTQRILCELEDTIAEAMIAHYNIQKMNEPSPQ